MGPEQAEWYFSVVTAQNARTLPHLVTVAVENAAALAKGRKIQRETRGEAYGSQGLKELFAPRILQRGWPITGRGRWRCSRGRAMLSTLSYWAGTVPGRDRPEGG